MADAATVPMPRISQAMEELRAQREVADRQAANLAARLAAAQRALERIRDEEYARPEEYAATGRDYAQPCSVVIADAALLETGQGKAPEPVTETAREGGRRARRA